MTGLIAKRISRLVVLSLLLASPGRGTEPTDEAVVITNSALSVTGIKEVYGRSDPIEIVVRPPQQNVLRARTEILLVRGDLSGRPIVQEVRKYDRYSDVLEQRFSLAPPAAERSGRFSLLVRVRGLRTRLTDDAVEPFEEKLTYRLSFTSDATSPTEPAGLAVRLEGAVLFDFEEDRLDARAQRAVEGWIAQLRSQSNVGRIVVEGHADKLGPPDYNLSLSRKRAKSVRAALIAGGVPGHIIKILGVGAGRPRIDREPTDEEDGIWENRRAEVVWYPTERP